MWWPPVIFTHCSPPQVLLLSRFKELRDKSSAVPLQCGCLFYTSMHPWHSGVLQQHLGVCGIPNIPANVLVSCTNPGLFYCQKFVRVKTAMGIKTGCCSFLENWICGTRLIWVFCLTYRAPFQVTSGRTLIFSVSHSGFWAESFYPQRGSADLSFRLHQCRRRPWPLLFLLSNSPALICIPAALAISQ